MSTQIANDEKCGSQRRFLTKSSSVNIGTLTDTSLLMLCARVSIGIICCPASADFNLKQNGRAKWKSDDE